MALLGLVGSVDAISINGAGSNAGQIAVPDLVGVFRQFDTVQFTLPFIVEQTKLDLCGVA